MLRSGLLFGKRSVGSSDVASGHRHFEDEDYIFRSIRAGASGFLLKRMRPEDLIAAVHTVAAGDSLLSPSVTRRVIDRMAQQPTPELADQTVVAASLHVSARFWGSSPAVSRIERSHWP